MICGTKVDNEYIVIPRSYVVGGSDKGDVSRDDVSRQRFSQRRNVERGSMFTRNLF